MTTPTAPRRRPAFTRRSSQSERPASAWPAGVICGLASLSLYIWGGFVLQALSNRAAAAAERAQQSQEMLGYQGMQGLGGFLFAIFVILAIWSGAVAITAAITAVTRSSVWAKCTAAALFIGALLMTPLMLAGYGFVAFALLIFLGVAMIQSYPAKRPWTSRRDARAELVNVF